MSDRPFHFIPASYRLICFLLICIPVLVTLLVSWQWSSQFALEQADRELMQSARSILDVVRTRYDLMHNYLFQEEKYLQENLNSSVTILHRMARELELEAARRKLSDSRAREIFISLVQDMKMSDEVDVLLLDQSDKVIQHSMLPKHFKMANYEWVRKMRERESGLIHYTWQYPGEAHSVDRISAFRLLHGWGWILSLESIVPNPEKSDFADQQIQGLEDYVTGYHSKYNGMAMILSVSDKSIITHPEISEGSIDQISGGPAILEAQNGNLVYEDDDGRRWRTGIVYFVPKRWIIAVTALEEEILKNSSSMILKLSLIASSILLICLFFFYRISRSLVYRSLASAGKDSIFK